MARQAEYQAWLDEPDPFCPPALTRRQWDVVRLALAPDEAAEELVDMIETWLVDETVVAGFLVEQLDAERPPPPPTPVEKLPALRAQHPSACPNRTDGKAVCAAERNATGPACTDVCVAIRD